MRTLLKLSIAAAALSASVAANAELLYGVSFDNQLVTFDSATPNNIVSGLFLQGLGGADVAGIDFRPSTGQLYVLGTNSTLYTANTTTGQLTTVGNLGTPLNGISFGFDFNPTVDRIRIISGTDQNLNVNPANPSDTIVQGTITPAGVNVGGVAYTNNFAGATSTTLYGIEGQNNNLVTIVPATGVTTTVGALGVNVTSLNGFDISGTSGVAYAALQTGGTGSTLYTINLATGAATSAGLIDTNSSVGALRGLTVAPAAVPEPASIAAIGVGLVALARRRKSKKA